jgi:cysteine synthase A
MSRVWVSDALRRIEADFNRSADTHLLRQELPAFPGLVLYFKDESSHTTGSLKHRLARSLFLYSLSNGWIGPQTTIVEASSGSTAVSEAYFARLIGLPFVAVMPRGTSAEKIAQIEFYGGRCHLVDSAAHVYAEAERLARECGGHYMDQFTYAERATDWRGNNNIAESILQQMTLEPYPVPRWIVVGAGTGGTSATIGRYLRYRDYATGLCVVDVENSVFLDYWRTRDPSLVCERPSRIEGIGRPRVEASFQPDVVDRMIRVPDAASLAAMRLVTGLLGRRVGASTGTHFVGVLHLLCEMKAAGESGSIVTLLCDSGERYGGTCYRDDWLVGQGIDIGPQLARLQAVLDSGRWRD